MSIDNGERERLVEAVRVDDCTALDALLEAQGDAARDALNAPTTWAAPPLALARTVETARRLVEAGADPAVVGAWWAPGFRVIECVRPDVGAFLAKCGAALTPHAAAGLGHVDALRAMIEADPGVVRAKGGDGCTPLHFARDVAIASLLLDAGAAIDARDDDHDSTPAQWLVKDAPAVTRFLLDRGATPDLFLAAALGDRALVERLVDDDPSRLGLCIGLAPVFAPIGHRGRGGTILQWTLGFNSFAHQFALARGHVALFDWMIERSDPRTQFLVACVTANRALAKHLAAAQPGIVDALSRKDLELLARYCWETNVNLEAVRLMLDVGWPIDVPETSHGYSPLHNAAWGGYADLVDLLIARGAPVDVRDPKYGSTPLDFAIHCCCEEGRHPEGEYTRVVNALIDAGSPWDPAIYPTGDAKIDAALGPRVEG